MNNATLAPELEVTDWFNTTNPLKITELRGKVIVIHAFQMLCPGCVSHGLPQASLIHQFYAQDNVQLIGLHSVFEHHKVMNADALRAFINEYQIRFPIAIDKPSSKGVIPVTMKKYQLQGTPSLILIDKQGIIRLNHFGRLSDLHIGNAIGKLLSTESKTSENFSPAESGDNSCNSNECKL